MPKWNVVRQGRRWAVTRFGEIVEGGFFSKEAAIQAKMRWMQEARE